MLKTLKLLGYTLFFILLLIYFIPKESLYYFVEKELQKEQVVLSDEEIVENLFSLELRGAKLSYRTIESLEVEMISVDIFLLYNSISLEGIKLSSTASSFVPLHLKKIDFSYTIFDPLVVSAKADGEFGEAEGEFNILDRNITMVLTPSKLMLKNYKSSLKNLSKNESGEYRYVQSF